MLKATKIDSMDFQLVDIDSIEIRDDKLRNSDVSADNIEMLKHQISNWGQLMPVILLREPETGKLVLDDGLQRTTALKELGEKQVLARIVDHDPVESNFIQMVANLGVKQTTGTEYARCLERILLQPEYAGMDLLEICKRLGIKKSESWIRNQLRLKNLCPEAEKKVNSGEVSATNASWLAKLSAENQIIYLQEAVDLKTDKFIALVEGALREEKAQKRGESTKDMDPLKGAKLRKVKEIKEKIVEQENIVADLSEVQINLEDAAQRAAYQSGYLGGLQWASSLDPETLSAKNKKQDELKALQEKQKQQRQELLENQRKMQEALRNGQLENVGL